FTSRLTAMCLCVCLLVGLVFAPFARSDSRPAFLVMDINTEPNPVLFTAPAGLTAVENTIYFAAWDERNGQELWKSDATGSGAVLVKDITPGTADTSFSAFVSVGEVLFFVTANQLWKSDGTTAGTLLVKEFAPGQGVFDLTAVNAMLFFVVGVAGGQLWRSDGTTAGTLLVKDIDIPSHLSYGYSMLSLNGMLIFSASDRRSGFELWKSDGTAAGTLRVKDINRDTGSSRPSYLVNVGGTAFFTAYNGRSLGLWKSNGTASGTVHIKDISICPTSNGSPLAIVSGTLFFPASTTSAGCELWKSDGTPAGTVMVKDLIPGVTDASPHMLTSVGGKLFFIGRDGDLVERLWVSDGTPSGTSLVTLRLRPWGLANLSGMLFVNAQANNESGIGLWKTDGTASGTVLVKNVQAHGLIAVQRMLFFGVYDDLNSYLVPWKSDGTAAGTVPIQRPRPGTQGAEVAELTDVNGTLFFVADKEYAGDELWKSDGTAAGTAIVRDISLGDLDSYPRQLTNVGGTLFFVAGEGGGYLWKSDGTEVGTVPVKAFTVGSLDYRSIYNYPDTRLIDLNGVLFFIASDENVLNRKIWKSDGTEAGTVPVTETNAAFAGTVVDLAAVNGTLFFATSGELWRTDGTMAGTQLVKTFDVLPPTCSRYCCIYPPPSPGKLTNINGRLFFSAYDEQTGYELYTSDGTTAGTRLVRDINPGVNDSAPDYLTNKSGTLFFSATDRVTGRELWTSDGTAAGTRLVVDLAPGLASAGPTWLADVRGTLFFAANDGVGGNELWRSDGTPAGTAQVVDLATGNSNPSEITLAGDTLFFSANDGNVGQELWAIRGGVDAYLEAPAWSGAAPGGAAIIPLRYGNLGLTSAEALTLTATLDPALEYLGDTTGSTPSVRGDTVQWRLPAAGFDAQTDFALRVGVPNAPFGATYPVTLTLTAAAETHPIDNTTRVDVVIARQLYFPAARR
ncbi:MAG TPA: ELWxxDGT repeat protein, partial [Roseiflexaceae bacterium]|nr:ELWxxDGT repeat protein [Roseiflexaceae bacterium]